VLYSGKRSKEPLRLNIPEVNHADDPCCFEEFDVKDDDDNDDDAIIGHVVDDSNAVVNDDE